MTTVFVENLVKADLLTALKDIETFLQGALKELHTKGELIERDQFNMARVDSLIRGLNAQVVDGGFGPAITDMMAGLMEIEGEVKKELGKDLEGASKFTAESEQAIQMLLTDAQSDMLKLANLEADSLSSYIRKSVLGGGKLSDLLTQISKELTIRYNQAMVLATTAIYSFKQMVTLDIADRLGVVWYVYRGPLDKITREWCEHWVGYRGTLEMFEATADKFGRESQPNPVKYWRGGYG